MSRRRSGSSSTMLPTAVVTLVTISLSWPSEGAIRGDGAVWALLWLVAGGLLAVFVRPSVRPAGGWMPLLALTCLVGGIWLSTWHVFQTGGDRRAALNLAFEWTALGVAWLAIARWIQAGDRILPGRLVVGLSLGAAALGLIQHHVIYPERAAWYLEQRSLLDSKIPGSLQEAAERQQALAEFQQLNIPQYGPQRTLFENRLLHSSEPTGPFALTNSLGGQLAVALILLVAAIFRGWQQDQLRTKLVAAVAAGLLLYCLILTKSRTAWLGTLAGLSLLAVLHRQHQLSRRVLKISSGLGVMLAVFIAAAVQTGALDREVIAEAPRSIQFRLMYWMGTAGVLQESPLLGTGPGNFRQPYLQHKPDEASEQILDPHNLFLDAWVTGGALSLAGMLLLVITAGRGAIQAIRFPPPAAEDSRSSAQQQHARRPAAPVLVGLFLSTLWYVATGGEFPWEAANLLQWQSGLWIVPVVAAGCMLLPLRSELTVPAASAAMLALMVHLLAAGGLQISGLMLLLLMLHAAVASAGPDRPGTQPPVAASQPDRLCRGLGAVGLAIGAVALIGFMLIPVQRASLLTQRAQYHQSNANWVAAEAAYREAVSADPLSVECHQQLAEFLAYKLGTTVVQNQTTVHNQAGEPAQQLWTAIERWLQIDPAAWQALKLRADARLRLASRSQVSDSLATEWERQAIRDLQQVVSLYPGNSAAWGELARAAWKNEQRELATTAARRALQLDKINQEWGHQDRLLPPETVAQLQEIQD